MGSIRIVNKGQYHASCGFAGLPSNKNQQKGNISFKKDYKEQFDHMWSKRDTVLEWTYSTEHFEKLPGDSRKR